MLPLMLSQDRCLQLLLLLLLVLPLPLLLLRIWSTQTSVAYCCPLLFTIIAPFKSSVGRLSQSSTFTLSIKVLLSQSQPISKPTVPEPLPHYDLILLLFHTVSWILKRKCPLLPFAQELWHISLTALLISVIIVVQVANPFLFFPALFVMQFSIVLPSKMSTRTQIK